MAKGHGGKREGAGRKAKKAAAPSAPGAKTSNFSTRIAPETRAAIELAAAGSRLSVSGMAQKLIQEALDQRRMNERNDATRAICYLIGELAEIVAPKQIKTDNFSADWRADPFLFEAFKLSILKLLDALRPQGEIIAPSELEPMLKNTSLWGSLESVEGRAEHAATILLHNLAAAQAPADLRDLAPKDDDTPYDLYRAWKGLKLGAGK